MERGRLPDGSPSHRRSCRRSANRRRRVPDGSPAHRASCGVVRRADPAKPVVRGYPMGAGRTVRCAVFPSCAASPRRTVAPSHRADRRRPAAQVTRWEPVAPGVMPRAHNARTHNARAPRPFARVARTPVEYNRLPDGRVRDPRRAILAAGISLASSKRRATCRVAPYPTCSHLVALCRLGCEHSLA